MPTDCKVVPESFNMTQISVVTMKCGTGSGLRLGRNALLGAVVLAVAEVNSDFAALGINLLHAADLSGSFSVIVLIDALARAY